MVTKKSSDAFTELLNFKQVELKQATENLLHVIVGSSAQEKRLAVERFNSILKLMAGMILVDETPFWIKRCVATSNQYLYELERDHNAPRELITSIAQYYADIRNQKWYLEDEPEAFSGVDFAEINTRIYTESEMPDLFSELAQMIQDVVDSGQVDSITATNTLQAIIDSIKKNSQKDAFSAKMFWSFGGEYLKIVVPKLIRTTDAGAAILDAYNETVTKIGFGLDAVVAKIDSEIRLVTSKKLPTIQAIADKAIHAQEPKNLTGPVVQSNHDE